MAQEQGSYSIFIKTDVKSELMLVHEKPGRVCEHRGKAVSHCLRKADMLEEHELRANMPIGATYC